MKYFYKDLLIVAIMLPLGFAITYFSLPRGEVIVYNCSMAEISPDYPVAVKDECRKLRLEKK